MPSREFAANIASPLFGGIPVTGAIARTATNVKNGGRTPVAGLVHARWSCWRSCCWWGAGRC